MRGGTEGMMKSPVSTAPAKADYSGGPDLMHTLFHRIFPVLRTNRSIYE
jgi:hypothetical protein